MEMKTRVYFKKGAILNYTFVNEEIGKQWLKENANKIKKWELIK